MGIKRSVEKSGDFYSLKSIGCRDMVWLCPSDWGIEDSANYASLRENDRVLMWKRSFLHLRRSKVRDDLRPYKVTTQFMSRTWLLKKASGDHLYGWVEVEYFKNDFRDATLTFGFDRYDEIGWHVSALSLMISSLFLAQSLDRLRIQCNRPEHKAFLKAGCFGEVRSVLRPDFGVCAGFTEDVIIETDRLLWGEREESQEAYRSMNYLKRQVEKFEREHDLIRKPVTKPVSFLARLLGFGARRRIMSGESWSRWTKRGQ